MASATTRFFFFGLLVFLTYPPHHLAVNLEISTNSTGSRNGTTTSTIQLVCNLDQWEANAHKVLLLSISKAGQDAPLVFIPNNQTGQSLDITYPKNQRQSNQNDIETSIENPTPNDSGLYSCDVTYVDVRGVVTSHKDSEYLTIRDNSLEALRQEVGNLTRGLFRLWKSINYKPEVIAFSAYNSKPMKLKTGQIVIFPDVSVNQGDAYNSTSGFFTTPKDGTYSLSLTITNACKTCITRLEVLKNSNDVLGRIDAEDHKSRDQSSVSFVSQLVEGDTVSIKATYALFSVIDSDKHSMFSGHLLG